MFSQTVDIDRVARSIARITPDFITPLNGAAMKVYSAENNGAIPLTQPFVPSRQFTADEFARSIRRNTLFDGAAPVVDALSFPSTVTGSTATLGNQAMSPALRVRATAKTADVNIVRYLVITMADTSGMISAQGGRTYTIYSTLRDPIFDVLIWPFLRISGRAALHHVAAATLSGASGFADATVSAGFVDLYQWGAIADLADAQFATKGAI